MVATQVLRSAYGESAPSGALRLVVSRSAAQRGPVYRRRRAVALAGLILLLAGLWFALQAAVSGAGGAPLTTAGAATGSPAVAKVWVVRPDDTLWTIALESGARGDIRPVVDRLVAETGGRPLQVGERIQLP